MTPTTPDSDARLLLKHSQGRITPARQTVLSMLLAAPAALSHQDIEQLTLEQGLTFDRVTLYRALEWLVEQGLAHMVAGTDRVRRYNALVGSPHQHAHFHCRSCTQVFCLENLQPALLFALPSGYQLDEVELNLQGRCPQCQKKLQANCKTEHS